jgi:hypothetical protein
VRLILTRTLGFFCTACVLLLMLASSTRFPGGRWEHGIGKLQTNAVTWDNAHDGLDIFVPSRMLSQAPLVVFARLDYPSDISDPSGPPDSPRNSRAPPLY